MMRACQGCNCAMAEDTPRWKKICNVCFRKAKDAELSRLKLELYDAQYILESLVDDGMLKKLIVLCHPDKHNNDRLSNEVTVFLLALRAKITGMEER